MAFNLEDYETVEERLEKFWKDNPNGRIETKMVEMANIQTNRVVFMASIYRSKDDQHPVATGWASEVQTDKGFNKFAIEVCESSSLGRAMANYVYAKRGSRPSRIEMERVQQSEQRSEPAPVSNEQGVWSVGEVAKELGATLIHETFECRHGAMVNKVGTAKTGKPFNGWVCIEKNKSNQCPAIWGRLGNNGQWVFAKENSNDYL